MKRRQAIGLCSLFTSGFVVGSGGWNQPGSAQSKPFLTMGTTPDFRPYSFYDSTTSKKTIVGLEIDIARAITSQQGSELKIIELNFKDLLPAVWNKRIDFAMAAITPTEKRRRNAVFSDVYFRSRNAIVSRSGTNIKRLDDLMNKRVGALIGTLQEGRANNLATKIRGMQVIGLGSMDDLLREIRASRLDAALIENVLASNYIPFNLDLEFNPILSEESIDYAIMFPKDSLLLSPFNSSLQKLEQAGELDRLARKWFSLSFSPTPAPLQPATPVPTPK